MGKRVRVQLANDAEKSWRSDRFPDRNCVYVGGLSSDVRDRDLEGFFNGFGNIKQISLKKVYAFVIFEDNRDADDAVKELSGRRLRGERVKLELISRQMENSEEAGLNTVQPTSEPDSCLICMEKIWHSVGKMSYFDQCSRPHWMHSDCLDNFISK